MKDKKYELTVSALIKYQDAMYRLAMSSLRNRDNALDVVQNSALRALEHYQSLRSPESVKSWLFRIVINESARYMRSAAKEIPNDQDITEEIYHEKAFNKHGEEVLEAVMKLPADLRVIVILRYYEDLSLKDISDITGVNINTVKSRLYASHKKLGAEIKEEYL